MGRIDHDRRPVRYRETLLALHFVFAGASRGEPGVIATLQENPMQLERILHGFGWSRNDPGIQLMYRSPVDLHLDEWVHDLLATLHRTGATRVAIDSLGDLRAACRDELRFREYVYSLLQRCARDSISVTMTLEVPDLFGVTHLSEYGISHLSDNVVLLQFLRGESELKRAIAVLKTRGSSHDQHVRQFSITADGVVVGEQFDPRQNLRWRSWAVSGRGREPKRLCPPRSRRPRGTRRQYRWTPPGHASAADHEQQGPQPDRRPVC